MNKILFLYTDAYFKAYICLCEQALKAVFRRFRKRVETEALQIDLSDSCRERMKEVLKEKISSADGVLFFGTHHNSHEEARFLKECFDLHTSMYFSGRKRILCPFSVTSVTRSESILKEESYIDLSSVKKTALLAVSDAKTRAGKLIITTDSSRESDRIMYGEFINSINTVHSCEVEHIEFDELIVALSKEILPFNTILCPSDKARIIAIYLSSFNRFCEAHSVLSADDIRIYKKELSPDSDLTNFSYASMLLSISDMLEAELNFKAMGQKFRRAITFSLDKCDYRQTEDFQKHLLIEINTPIRHRRARG